MRKFGSLFVWCIVLLACALCSSDAQTAQQVRAVSFLGNTVVSENDLRQAAQPSPDRPYDAARAAEDIARIEKLYADRGYTLARVRDAEMLPDGTLRFDIVEGVIERVAIIGNRHTRGALIRSLLRLNAGMVYNEQTAKADRRRLADLNLFDSVVIEPVPAREGHKVELRVRVKERQTAYITGAAAYGSHVGLVGYLDMGEENFLGLAQSLNFQWQRGVIVDSAAFDDRLERRSAYQLSYEDPLVRPGRVSWGLDLYHRETLFSPVFTALDLSPRMFMFREGGVARAGTAFSADTKAFLSYRRDRVNFNDLPAGLLPPSELIDSAGTVASLALSGILDRRDHKLYPRRGYYGEIRAEQGARGLGGSFDYGRYTLDARGFFPQGRGSLHLRALFGASTRGTPLSEQFWMGGYRLMRGYDFDEFHGTRMAFFSAEYDWPVMQGIETAVFLEEGYAWPRDASARLSDLRLGGGIGLRFLTSLGPIRFDLATGNRRVHTYLTLGQAY